MHVSEAFFILGTPKIKTVINVIKDSPLLAKASAWHCVSVLAQEVLASPALS